jgi:hypothetical protein
MPDINAVNVVDTSAQYETLTDLLLERMDIYSQHQAFVEAKSNRKSEKGTMNRNSHTSPLLGSWKILHVWSLKATYLVNMTMNSTLGYV